MSKNLMYLCVCLSALTVFADPIVVPNYSFEDDGVTNTTEVVMTPSSWELVWMGGRTGTYNKMINLGASAPDGEVVARIKPENSNNGGAVEGGYRYQNSAPLDAAPGLPGMTLLPFKVYTLTVSVRRENGAFARIELLAATNAVPASARDYQVVAQTLASSTGFTDEVVTLDTGAEPSLVGQYLKVGLHVWRDASRNLYGDFDNIRLDVGPSAIPEPGVTAMVILGLLLLRGCRRRNRS